mmetsp:Transcript_52765/g.115108  ORF Transcript_52765/g.115108 Transcript_52765/m.115108 type:complete len:261 (+) Transcript_52765:216-998(+)
MQRAAALGLLCLLPSSIQALSRLQTDGAQHFSTRHVRSFCHHAHSVPLPGRWECSSTSLLLAQTVGTGYQHRARSRSPILSSSIAIMEFDVASLMMSISLCFTYGYLSKQVSALRADFNDDFHRLLDKAARAHSRALDAVDGLIYSGLPIASEKLPPLMEKIDASLVEIRDSMVIDVYKESATIVQDSSAYLGASIVEKALARIELDRSKALRRIDDCRRSSSQNRCLSRTATLAFFPVLIGVHDFSDIVVRFGTCRIIW